MKRVLSEENPAVKPGQIGKVVEVFETSIAEGFGIVVDWGNGELWWYETPGSYEERHGADRASQVQAPERRMSNDPECG